MNNPELDEEVGLPLYFASSGGMQPIVERLLAAGADVHANDDAALREAHGHWPVVESLLAAGAAPSAVPWGDVPATVLRRLVIRISAEQFLQLPPQAQEAWLRYHVWIKYQLRRRLYRARDRLDRPQQGEPLGAGMPTRERLIAHLRTAGRRFAREYWTEGIPIFWKGAELGPVPDEFLERRD